MTSAIFNLNVDKLSVASCRALSWYFLVQVLTHFHSSLRSCVIRRITTMYTLGIAFAFVFKESAQNIFDSIGRLGFHLIGSQAHSG